MPKLRPVQSYKASSLFADYRVKLMNRQGGKEKQMIAAKLRN